MTCTQVAVVSNHSNTLRTMAATLMHQYTGTAIMDQNRIDATVAGVLAGCRGRAQSSQEPRALAWVLPIGLSELALALPTGANGLAWAALVDSEPVR